MAVNKVVINNETKLDLTADTVDAAHLAKGFTAHDMKGESIVGTMESGGVSGSHIKADLQYRQVNIRHGAKKDVWYLHNCEIHGFKEFPKLSNIYGTLYMDNAVEKMSEHYCIDSSHLTDIRFSENEKFTTIPEYGISGLYINNDSTITLPDNITTLEKYAFYNLTSKLSSVYPTTIKLGKNITTINDSFMGRADRGLILDFSAATKIPTLTTSSLCERWKGSSTASYYLCTLMDIIVPDALYDEWIKATNWAYWNSSSSASLSHYDGHYFKKASEVTA